MIKFAYNNAIAGMEKLVEKNDRNYIIIKQISDEQYCVSAIGEQTFISAELLNNLAEPMDDNGSAWNDVGDMVTVPADVFARICSIGNAADTYCLIQFTHTIEPPATALDVEKKKTRVKINHDAMETIVEYYTPATTVPEIVNLNIKYDYNESAVGMQILFGKEFVAVVNFFKKYVPVKCYTIHDNMYTVFHHELIEGKIIACCLNDKNGSKETPSRPPYILNNSINNEWK